MTKKHIVAFVILGTVAVAGWAVSIPNSFTAQTAAKASEVNANFTALANAVTTLESKVAALEAANSPLTTADVAGTWKFLSLSSRVVRDGAERNFGVRSSTSEGSMTFTATSATGGTLDFSGSINASGFNGKGTLCNAPDNGRTQNEAPSTTGDPNGSHSHLYSVQTCTTGGFVQPDPGPSPVEGAGGVPWVLGPAANTITITSHAGDSYTVYFSKPGRVGFAVKSSDETDANPNQAGRKFDLDVLVRQ